LPFRIPPPPPFGKGGFGCGCGFDQAMIRAHEECGFAMCQWCGGWMPKSDKLVVAEREAAEAAHRLASYHAVDAAILRSAMGGVT
jgi:hypothetical protein